MLHISIRPQENVIIRNHLKSQSWGAEERHGGSPVQAHQSFEIAITADHSVYRISVNGNHFCTFVHRLPVTLVRYVSLSGTCSIAYITCDHSGSSSSYPPAHMPPVHVPVAPHYPIHHHPPAPPPPPTAPPPYPGIFRKAQFSLMKLKHSSLLQVSTQAMVIQHHTRYLNMNFNTSLTT